LPIGDAAERRRRVCDVDQSLLLPDVARLFLLDAFRQRIGVAEQKIGRRQFCTAHKKNNAKEE
jgi:hypothetical protein